MKLRCMTALPKLLPTVLAMLIVTGTAQAAEVKLIAANALKEAVLELVPEYSSLEPFVQSRPMCTELFRTPSRDGATLHGRWRFRTALLGCG